MKIVNLSDHILDSYDQFKIDVLSGLSAPVKSISAKYFYDDTGSELFQKITQQSDYYLTSQEYSILNDICPKIPTLLGKRNEIDIIELGVGDGHKSKLIIEAFLAEAIQVNYYPIDISKQASELLKRNLIKSPNLTTEFVVADYFTGLNYIKSYSRNLQLVLFLGANIGNFEHQQALEFLHHLWIILNHNDYVLIGFDQKKDISLLNKAYNDSSEYTKQFNLNLLARINRELKGNFNLEKFQHYGFYNPKLGAMESYLISLDEQWVNIQDLHRSFHFKQFEPIHLEYSFKFQPKDIELLSQESGFRIIENFTDKNNYFIDSLWSVNKTL